MFQVLFPSLSWRKLSAVPWLGNDFGKNLRVAITEPDDEKKEGRGIGMEGGQSEFPLHAVHPLARQVTVDLNIETWSYVFINI